MANGQNQNLGSTTTVAQTPVQSPFLPDPSLLPPQGDAYAELTNLLQQIQSQSFQPQKQGALETILNALASGASIAASNDPGAALGNVLNQRLQVQQNRENAERARQGQIQTAMIQSMLEKARGTQAAQTSSRELRLKGALDTEQGVQQVANQATIDLNRLELKQREQIETEDFLNRTADARAIRNRKESPELFNQSTQLAQQMVQFIPTMPAIVARGIAEKLNGQDLNAFTKEETLFYNRYKQARSEDWKQDKDLKRRVAESEISENEAQAEYYRKISAMGGNKSDPILSNLADEYSKKAFSPVVKTRDGQIISVIDLPKLGLSGEFGTSPASPEETFKFQQEQLKAFTKLNENMRGGVNQVNSSMPGSPSQQQNMNFFRSNVEALRQKGRTDDQIKQALQVNGATPEQIKQLVPSKVQPPTKGKSVIKPLPPNYFNNTKQF
jgi:hypothetical protein